MRRLLNPKRVTWASDVNLCQVRLFLSEESPSQVGLGAQDHLQAKSSWTSQTSGITSDDNLPPGFEGAQASNLWRTKLAQIPLVKWELPTRFILEPNWRVVAGEESQEVEVQKQREMRVLEAIYPRPSAIPLNPSVPAENFVHNDQQTPLIPITPIEEEDGADTSQDAVAPNLAGAASSQSASNNLPVNGITATGAAPSLEPDVLAVAQAALSAIMANDQGNLIDRELLMKILGDPQIIGQLVRHHGGGGGGGTTLQSMPAAATTQARPATSLPSMPAMGVHNMPAAAMQNMSNMRPPGFGFSTPTPAPISSAHGNRPDLVAPSIPGTSSAPFNPPPGRIGSIPNMRPPMPDVLSASTSSVRAPLPVTSSSSSSTGGQAKDINYYKSLIQQHGGERQDAPPPFSGRSSNHHVVDSVQEPPMNSRSRDSKPKIMKPCIYFNSSRGCRHGVNCSYLHDTPSQQRVTNLPEVQNAKRMKMDRDLCVPAYLNSSDSSFPLCSESCDGKKVNLIWVVGISVGIVIVGIVLFLKRWCSQQREITVHEDSLSSSVFSYDLKSFHRLSFEQREIFEGMVEKNIVGYGGSGTVYKVELGNGDAIAVKRLWSRKGKDPVSDNQIVIDKELKTEVETLGSIRHKNIVKLYCYFSSLDCNLLVYEYMPNGNLWDALHKGKMVLDWPTRYQICLGIAQGLAYLHHDLLRPIIHRDIKSTNILLDIDYHPKVADFGIAKVLQARGGKDSTTTVIAGTYGYLAPEYAYSSKATTKCDVYSFGVVLLEVITGKKPVEAEFGENKNIVYWVSTKVETKEEAYEVLDKRVTGWFKEDMMKVLRIAIRCTCRTPALRPTMKEVVQQLIEADPCRFDCCKLSSSNKTKEKDNVVKPKDMYDH